MQRPSTSAATRIGFRLYNEELRPLEGTIRTRLLTVGAGDAGDSVLREIIRASEDRYQVVVFLDDDAGNLGARIHGVSMLGRTAEIRRICESCRVDDILIAMRSPPHRRIRYLIEICKGTNLRFRTMPTLADLIEGKVHQEGICA